MTYRQGGDKKMSFPTFQFLVPKVVPVHKNKYLCLKKNMVKTRNHECEAFKIGHLRWERDLGTTGKRSILVPKALDVAGTRGQICRSFIHAGLSGVEKGSFPRSQKSFPGMRDDSVCKLLKIQSVLVPKISSFPALSFAWKRLKSLSFPRSRPSPILRIGGCLYRTSPTTFYDIQREPKIFFQKNDNQRRLKYANPGSGPGNKNRVGDCR